MDCAQLARLPKPRNLNGFLDISSLARIYCIWCTHRDTGVNVMSRAENGGFGRPRRLPAAAAAEAAAATAAAADVADDDAADAALFPAAGLSSIYRVSRLLDREGRGLFSSLASIAADAAFVAELHSLYRPRLPLVANLRCGLWCVPWEEAAAHDPPPSAASQPTCRRTCVPTRPPAFEQVHAAARRRGLL